MKGQHSSGALLLENGRLKIEDQRQAKRGHTFKVGAGEILLFKWNGPKSELTI